MVALVRRMWLFMGLSALLNGAMLALVGYFWQPLPDVLPLPAPKMILLTLLPPPPKVKPPPRPRPKPRRPKQRPRAKATPLPPAPRHTPKVAPAASGGGTPKSRPKRMPKRASQFHALLGAKSDIDLPPSDQNLDTDEPPQSVSDQGAAPPAPDPGKAKTPDPGKVDTPTPGTADGDKKGSGLTGTGDGPGKGAGAGAGAGLFGTHADGGGGNAARHIVYVLDISGSMNMTEQKFHGKSRIAEAREELDKQFQTLSNGETFSLIAFSDNIHYFRHELVKPDPDTLKAAEAFLDALEPDGDTDLEDALKVALAMPGVNVVVVITDGVPHTQKIDYETQEDFDKLASRIEAADRGKIPIFAYGLLGPNPDGTDDSQEAEAFLTQVAHDSGGNFTEVKLDGESR